MMKKRTILFLIFISFFLVTACNKLSQGKAASMIKKVTPPLTIGYQGAPGQGYTYECYWTTPFNCQKTNIGKIAQHGFLEYSVSWGDNHYYRFTQKGQQYVLKEEIGMFNAARASVKIADVDRVQVKSISEPTPFMGQTICIVRYDVYYNTNDFGLIQLGQKSFKKSAETVFVLYSDGWKIEGEDIETTNEQTRKEDKRVRDKMEELNRQYEKQLEGVKRQVQETTRRDNNEESRKGGFSFFNNNKNSQDSDKYNQIARADLKSVYAITQNYFRHKSDGLITLKELTKYGYKSSSGVELNIVDGNRHKLRISAKHDKGNVIYMIDDRGTIIEKKFNSESVNKSHEKFTREEYDIDADIAIAVGRFLQNNLSYRKADREDNLDKDCLQLEYFPYSNVGDLTGDGNKDYVVCFIDSKVTPGKYRDNKGYMRLRGQFVIVIFSMVQGKLQPFIIEKEFPLERGIVSVKENTLYVQQLCESGPIIAYEWHKGAFVKNIVGD